MFSKAVEYFPIILNLQGTNIPIKVQIVDNIGRGETAGTCAPAFDKDYKIKHIDIVIKRATTTIGMIEALAHEMVHARQWIDGDLTFEIKTAFLLGFIPYPKVHRYWKGEETTELDYFDQPAEIEAHLLQRFLTLEFLKIVENKIEPNEMRVLLNK
jgi:hypothetical protein